MPSKTNYDLVNDDGYDMRIPLHNEEAFQHGISYHAKYIGALEVPRPTSRIEIVSAMRRIRYEFKAKAIKKRNVEIVISVEGVKIALKRKKEILPIHRDKEKDLQQSRPKKNQWYWDEERFILMHHPVYRIFYVSHDSQDLQIFSYIAREAHSNIFRCNVFKAAKKSEAMRIVRSIGQAFEVCHKQSLAATSGGGADEGEGETTGGEPEPTAENSTPKAHPTAPPTSTSDSADASPISVADVSQSRNLAPGSEQPVAHASTSAPPTELQSLDDWSSLARTATGSNSVVPPGSVGSHTHQLKLLRQQLELQTQQTSAAVAQVTHLKGQLATETAARVEAQERTQQLLGQNRELIQQMFELVSRITESGSEGALVEALAGVAPDAIAGVGGVRRPDGLLQSDERFSRRFGHVDSTTASSSTSISPFPPNPDDLDEIIEDCRPNTISRVDSGLSSINGSSDGRFTRAIGGNPSFMDVSFRRPKVQRIHPALNSAAMSSVQAKLKSIMVSQHLKSNDSRASNASSLSASPCLPIRSRGNSVGPSPPIPPRFFPEEKVHFVKSKSLPVDCTNAADDTHAVPKSRNVAQKIREKVSRKHASCELRSAASSSFPRSIVQNAEAMVDTPPLRSYSAMRTSISAGAALSTGQQTSERSNSQQESHPRSDSRIDASNYSLSWLSSFAGTPTSSTNPFQWSLPSDSPLSISQDGTFSMGSVSGNIGAVQKTTPATARAAPPTSLQSSRTTPRLDPPPSFSRRGTAKLTPSSRSLSVTPAGSADHCVRKVSQLSPTNSTALSSIDSTSDTSDFDPLAPTSRLMTNTTSFDESSPRPSQAVLRASHTDGNVRRAAGNATGEMRSIAESAAPPVKPSITATSDLGASMEASHSYSLDNEDDAKRGPSISPRDGATASCGVHPTMSLACQRGSKSRTTGLDSPDSGLEQSTIAPTVQYEP